MSICSLTTSFCNSVLKWVFLPSPCCSKTDVIPRGNVNKSSVYRYLVFKVFLPPFLKKSLCKAMYGNEIRVSYSILIPPPTPNLQHRCTEPTRRFGNYISWAVTQISALHLVDVTYGGCWEVNGEVGGQWPWLAWLRNGGRNASDMPSQSQVLVALQGKEGAFIQLCKHCGVSLKSPRLSKLF